MSLITDLRAVSENVVEQIAARFSDLPRPLLAAIGAGDMAIERLAELAESFEDSVSERVASGSREVAGLRSAVSDMPSRAQQVASDVAGNIEQFANEAPGKAQDLIAQLPDKLAELQAAAQSLSPDALKETVGAYTQLVGLIYGNLAERGDKTWTKVRGAGLEPGAVVDAAEESGTTNKPSDSAVPAPPNENTASNGSAASATDQDSTTGARDGRRAAPESGDGRSEPSPDPTAPGTAATANREKPAAKKPARRSATAKQVVPKSPTLKVTDKPGADMPVVTPINES